ncbi:MAG: sulfotransferase [Methylophagaceae bacterium]
MLDFLGIGARKAATTWVFKRLSMHSETYFPLGKEVHYWNNLEKKSGDTYKKIFRNSKFSAANGFKCGEITPDYALIDEHAIQKIYEFTPQCKVFYIVRNPVDCIWSTLKHHFRLQGKDIKMAEESDLHQMVNDRLTKNHLDYASNILRWKKYFNDLCILDYSLIEKDPKYFLSLLCSHLEIDEDYYQFIPDKLIKEVIHTSKGGKIPHQLYKRIYSEVEPQITALEDLEGLNLSHWRKNETA